MELKEEETVRYHGDAEAYIMQSNGTTQIQTSNTWGGINTITGQTQPVLTGTFYILHNRINKQTNKHGNQILHSSKHRKRIYYSCR